MLTAIGCWGLLYFKTETKGIRYFPEESKVVKDYRYLEESLSGIINLDVDLYFPPEEEREFGLRFSDWLKGRLDKIFGGEEEREEEREEQQPEETPQEEPAPPPSEPGQRDKIH